jgi:transposase
LVQKLVKQQQTEGNLLPKKREKPRFSHLANAEAEVRALVAEYPDATLIELSELLLQRTGNWVSRTALCRYLQKLELNRKKKHGTVAKPGQKEYKNSELSIGKKSEISRSKT